MRNLYLAMLVLLTSCGAKKKVKEVSRIKSDSLSVTYRGVDLNKIEKEWVFIPTVIDKPIIINQDTVYNARIEYRDRVVDSVVRELDTVFVTKQVAKKSKEVESEGWNWKGLNWALLFLFLALCVWVFYKLRKK